MKKIILKKEVKLEEVFLQILTKEKQRGFLIKRKRNIF